MSIWPQFYNEFKECEKKIQVQIFKVMKLTSKLYLVGCFYALLLMIGFKDLILIFYIWVPTLTIEVIMKNDQF